MEENELYDRIGETDLNPTYKDGQPYMHTDINQMLGILKTAINENYYDIQRLLNGVKTVGNSEKLDGASLSRYIDEELQSDDNKIPSSQQAKAYMDALFAGYSAPVRGVDYWTEADQQQIVSDTASNVIEEITPDLEEALNAKANINDIPTKVSDLTNDEEFITKDVDNLTNYYKKEVVNKKPYYFDNIADMKAYDLKVGDCVITLGYYEPNDGGAGEYKIVNDNTLTDDGGSIINLNNNLKAKLLISNNEVCYNQFGAKGDGITDDYNSLSNTHNFANANNYKVIANNKSTYYIKNFSHGIAVKTDVDWGKARFIIDDREVTPTNNLNSIYLFLIERTTNEVDVTDLLSNVSIIKGQEYITELANNGECIVKISNSNKKIYIRHGANPNNGVDLFDIFRINNDGKVLDSIVWDFDTITSAKLYLIDKEPLIINGGIFTTIVNTYDSYIYFNRGIRVTRSNVTIKNLEHYVDGEDTPTSSPYNAFISTYHTYNMLLKDCIFTGRKYWRTPSNVVKGTYDFRTEEDINITMSGCKSSNSITDRNYWSTFAGNNSKKLLLENCEFNRFGSHMGFWDFTIKDSIIGARGMGFMGGGVANFENVKVLNQEYFVELKPDYGASFDGIFNIKNCSISYENPSSTSLYNIPTIISSDNDGSYDYGIKPVLPILNINGFTFLYGGGIGNETCTVYKLTQPKTGVDYTKTYEENAALGYYPQAFFPEINCKNIKLTDKEHQIFRLSSAVDLWNAYVSEKGTALNYYDNTNYPSSKNTVRNWEGLVIPNCKIVLDNCEFSDDYTTKIFNRMRCSLYGTGDYNVGEINDNHHFVPEIIIKNIKHPLFFGVGHRSGIFRIINCNIRGITTSSADNLTYCFFDVKNSKFFYSYYNDTYPTGSSSARCRPNWNQFRFENVSFDKDANAALSDMYQYEVPFSSMIINTVTQHFLRMSGDVIDCKFWGTFGAEVEDVSMFNSDGRKTYNFSMEQIGNHKGVIKFPRTTGLTTQRPVEDTDYKIPIGSTYYDTNLSKLIIWNGSSWVDATGTAV